MRPRRLFILSVFGIISILIGYTEAPAKEKQAPKSDTMIYKPIWQVEHPNFAARYMVFSPDGKLWAASDRGTYYLYQDDTQIRAGDWPASVSDLFFTPDKKSLWGGAATLDLSTGTATGRDTHVDAPTNSRALIAIRDTYQIPGLAGLIVFTELRQPRGIGAPSLHLDMPFAWVHVQGGTQTQIKAYRSLGRPKILVRNPTGGFASVGRGIDLFIGTQLTKHIEFGDNSYTASAAFSADGEQLAVGRVDGSVLVFDTKTWKHTSFVHHKRPVDIVAFAADDRSIFSASEETGEIWLHTNGQGHKILTIKNLVSLAVSPVNHALLIASYGQSGVIQMYAPDTKQ